MAKIIREITDWGDLEYTPANHDYLVLEDGRCIAFRRAGSDDWQKFSAPRQFSRSRRRFKTLKEEEPSNFVKPYALNGWEQNSYNSLEAYFG